MNSKVIMVLAAIFIGICTVKIAPVYMSGYTVSSVVSNLTEEAAAKGYARRGISERLIKRFDTNNITAITPKDVSIEITGDEVILDANYEARIPFVFNIDVVVRFENNQFTAPIN